MYIYIYLHMHVCTYECSYSDHKLKNTYFLINKFKNRIS